VFIDDQNAVSGKIIGALKGIAGEKVVNGFVKLQADGGVLVVQEEGKFGAGLLTEADLDPVRDFEQPRKAADLAEPSHQVEIKVGVAHRADINCPAQTESVDGEGRFAGVEIL